MILCSEIWLLLLLGRTVHPWTVFDLIVPLNTPNFVPHPVHSKYSRDKASLIYISSKYKTLKYYAHYYKCKTHVAIIYCTLLERQSRFPRYTGNMNCRGKPDTTWTISRSITFSPLFFMLYRGKSITFVTV